VNLFNAKNLLNQQINDHDVFIQELIGHMLQVNVEARYTAEDVLSHPWVTVDVS